MTYAEAIAALERLTPLDRIGESMRQAGVLAVRDVQRVVEKFHAEHPKAAPGTLTINGRTPEETCDYIVEFYSGMTAVSEEGSRG